MWRCLLQNSKERWEISRRACSENGGGSTVQISDQVWTGRPMKNNARQSPCPDLDVEEAKTLVLLSEGGLVPPVGSHVEVHLYVENDHKLTACLLKAEILEWNGVDAVLLKRRSAMFHHQNVEDLKPFWWHLSLNAEECWKYALFPTKLPKNCPHVSSWPRLSKQDRR